MRTSGVLFSAISIALLIPTYSYGQGSDPRATEEQPEPYHKHHDTRQGHDHFYPDRGSILRDAPQGAIVVTYAGLSYRFHDGVWLEPRGPAFMVVAPPIGLIVPTLPTFATLLAHGGEIYLYCNEVYYRPRPDLNGYEVINDPAEMTAKAKSDAAVAAPVAAKPTLAARAAAPPPATAEDDNGEPAVVTPAAIPVARAVGAGAASGAVTSAGSASLPASVSSPASVSLPASVGSLASASSPPSVNSSAVVPASAAMRSVPIPTTPGTTPAVSISSATPSNVVVASPPAPATGPTTGPPASITVATATPPGPASVPAAPVSTPTAPPSAAPPTPPAVPSATTPIAVPVAAPVTPTTTSSSTTTPDPPKGIRATLYPKNGQGADQLAHDRYDCYRFAVAQTGFDPVRSGGSTSATASQQQYDYDRAQSACFEARGYTVH
jgi:hypothetical protein